MLYTFDRYELDAYAHELRRDGEPLPVEPQVFDLLHLLVRRAGDLLSRDVLIAEIWDGRIVSDAAIDARLAAARRAVGDDGRRQRMIRTVPRRGVQFVAEVRRSEGSPPEGLGGPNRPSIAVLSFRPLDAHPLTESLGEGLAEDVIIELSRAAELFVVARQSSFRFDPATTDSAAVGESLCVRFLLSGTVRTSGDRLRLTVHLVRCASGEELWAERYDRPLEETFEVQTEIARTVTATVVGRMAVTDAPRARSSGGSLTAYPILLDGVRAMHRYTCEDMEAARESFRTAAELAPDWARPHGLLAMTEIYVRWYYEVDADVSAAVPPAERAVALDARDTKGHCALGIARLMAGDHARASQHFETGLRMNRNDDLLLVESGRFMMYDDRADEGVACVREAMRLNPFHPNWYWNILGRCLHTLGRYDDALDAFSRVANPPFWTLAYSAGCASMAGHPEQAAALVAQVLAVRPDFSLERFGAILPYRNPDTKAGFMSSLAAAGLPR
jgi:TolB-like protein